METSIRKFDRRQPTFNRLWEEGHPHRVLLVKPNHFSDHIQPPLGLGYLAAHVGRTRPVAIADMVFLGWHLSDLLDFVRKQDVRVVGYQCYTFDVPLIREYSQALARERGNQTAQLVGGPHPSGRPGRPRPWEDFEGGIDYGFEGEAEHSLTRFLDILFSGDETSGHTDSPPWRDPVRRRVLEEKVPGLWGYDPRGRKHFAARRPVKVVENLEDLGRPDWELLRPQDYPEAQHGAFFRQFPIAPVIFTRGCPYRCTFCSAPQISGKKIRRTDPAFMLEQLRFLRHELGIREIHIVDDNFTFDKDYAREVLRRMVSAGLGLSLATPNGVRLDRLDEDLLRLFRAAGLYLISVGVESGSDRILRLMRKSLKVETIRRQVALIRKAGIEVAAFFILGYPGETRAEVELTLRLSRELDLTRANFFHYLPFPGTESHEQVVAGRKMNGVDWNHLFFMLPTGSNGQLSARELKWLQRRAFLSFYLRPRIFLRQIRAIRGWRHFGFLVRRFYHWILMRGPRRPGLRRFRLNKI